MTLLRRLLPLTVAVATATWGSPGRAQSSVTVHEIDPRTGATAEQRDVLLAYFNPGVLFSIVGGDHTATAIGVEASYAVYPLGRMPSLGYGPLAQLQLYDGKWVRAAAGGEVMLGPIGLELGLGFRQADGTYGSTFSTHTAEFLSVAYLSIGLRESVPLLALPGGAASFGFETAFVIALKVPVGVRGEEPTRAVPSVSGNPW